MSDILLCNNLITMLSGHHDHHHVKDDGGVKVLYIRMRGYSENYDECEWWVLERDGKDGVSPLAFYREDELRRQQHGNDNMVIDDYFGCAVFGEEIYMIGGSRFDCNPDLPRPNLGHSVEFSKVVRIYHRGTREWSNGEPMLVARCKPTVAILLGKIYVFGGLLYYYPGYSQPWAEYYDPMSRKWYPVPNIPSTLCLAMFEHAVLLGEDRILLMHFTNGFTFYLFDANEESWESFSDNHHAGYNFDYGLPSTLANATEDHVLYWYHGDSLFALDLLRNNKSSSSDIGGPIFTFNNIWDGPNFVPSVAWLVIDDISNEEEKKMKKKKMACLIWYDSIAKAIIYTNFELLILVEDHGRRIEAKWNERYQRLNFNPHDATIRYHMDHCLQMVSLSSSRDKDHKAAASPNSSSLFGRHQHGLVLQNLYDNCITQQALARGSERYRMEKELAKKVKNRVEPWDEEDDVDQALKGFMNEHEIQELKDQNIDLDTFRFSNEWKSWDWVGRGLRIPRAQRIKLAIAFGHTSEFMEVYERKHQYGSPCYTCSERSCDLSPRTLYHSVTNQNPEATSNFDPNQLEVSYDSDSDEGSNSSRNHDLVLI